MLVFAMWSLNGSLDAKDKDSTLGELINGKVVFWKIIPERQRVVAVFETRVDKLDELILEVKSKLSMKLGGPNKIKSDIFSTAEEEPIDPQIVGRVRFYLKILDVLTANYAYKEKIMLSSRLDFDDIRLGLILAFLGATKVDTLLSIATWLLNWDYQYAKTIYESLLGKNMINVEGVEGTVTLALGFSVFLERIYDLVRQAIRNMPSPQDNCCVKILRGTSVEEVCESDVSLDSVLAIKLFCGDIINEIHWRAILKEINQILH